MPIHYRKSIRIGKYFRINLSKSGIGYSAGVRGLRISSGPRGSRMTASVPGTGLSYTQQIGTRKLGKRQNTLSQPLPDTTRNLPVPGFFAPRHEKDLYNGLMALHEGNQEKAIPLLVTAAAKEPGAALLAGSLLASRGRTAPEAIRLLESVISSDTDFPTPLMQKYMSDVSLTADVTENVEAHIPVDTVGAVLLLVELYQAQDRIDDAIGLLEEIDDLTNDPVVTLSICDLYSGAELWDGIIERSSGIEVVDDITLELAILHAQALQVKGLHEATIAVLKPAVLPIKNRSAELRREAIYLRAVSYLATNKLAMASKEFQRIYAEDPKYRDVAQRLGF